MHCPRCGTSAAVDQPFCRSCGLNLEKVAEFLGEELVAPHPETTTHLVRLRERQQKFEQWGGIVALSTGIMFLTLAVIIIRGMILGTTALLPGAFFISLIIIASVMVSLLSYSKSLKGKLAARPLPASSQLPAKDTEELYPYRKPLDSVADRTTELLTSSKKVDTAEIDD